MYICVCIFCMFFKRYLCTHYSEVLGRRDVKDKDWAIMEDIQICLSFYCHPMLICSDWLHDSIIEIRNLPERTIISSIYNVMLIVFILDPDILSVSLPFKKTYPSKKQKIKIVFFPWIWFDSYVFWWQWCYITFVLFLILGLKKNVFP